MASIRVQVLNSRLDVIDTETLIVATDVAETVADYRARGFQTEAIDLSAVTLSAPNGDGTETFVTIRSSAYLTA